MKFFLSVAAAALLASTAWAEAPDTATLRPKLEKLETAGSAEAAYHLGMIYHMGLGVPADQKRAFQLFREAADGGDPLGAYKVDCYYDGQGEGVVASDGDAALRYKLAAAKAGYALAQHDVAMHLLGSGDHDGAICWLEAAARQGNLGSLFALAEFAHQSNNRIKAAAYLKIAAQQLSEAPELQAQLQSSATKELAGEDAHQADALVAAFSISRSPVTQRADKGLSRAEELVSGS